MSPSATTLEGSTCGNTAGARMRGRQGLVRYAAAARSEPVRSTSVADAFGHR